MGGESFGSNVETKAVRSTSFSLQESNTSRNYPGGAENGAKNGAIDLRLKPFKSKGLPTVEAASAAPKTAPKTAPWRRFRRLRAANRSHFGSRSFSISVFVDLARGLLLRQSKEVY
jgi:hypothetical protein